MSWRDSLREKQLPAAQKHGADPPASESGSIHSTEPASTPGQPPAGIGTAPGPNELASEEPLVTAGQLQQHRRRWCRVVHTVWAQGPGLTDSLTPFGHDESACAAFLHGFFPRRSSVRYRVFVANVIRIAIAAAATREEAKTGNPAAVELAGKLDAVAGLAAAASSGVVQSGKDAGGGGVAPASSGAKAGDDTGGGATAGVVDGAESPSNKYLNIQKQSDVPLTTLSGEQSKAGDGGVKPANSGVKGDDPGGGAQNAGGDAGGGAIIGMGGGTDVPAAARKPPTPKKGKDEKTPTKGKKSGDGTTPKKRGKSATPTKKTPTKGGKKPFKKAFDESSARSDDEQEEHGKKKIDKQSAESADDDDADVEIIDAAALPANSPSKPGVTPPVSSLIPAPTTSTEKKDDTTKATHHAASTTPPASDKKQEDSTETPAMGDAATPPASDNKVDDDTKKKAEAANAVESTAAPSAARSPAPSAAVEGEASALVDDKKNVGSAPTPAGVTVGHTPSLAQAASSFDPAASAFDSPPVLVTTPLTIDEELEDLYATGYGVVENLTTWDKEKEPTRQQRLGARLYLLRNPGVKIPSFAWLKDFRRDEANAADEALLSQSDVNLSHDERLRVAAFHQRAASPPALITAEASGNKTQPTAHKPTPINSKASLLSSLSLSSPKASVAITDRLIELLTLGAFVIDERTSEDELVDNERLAAHLFLLRNPKVIPPAWLTSFDRNQADAEDAALRERPGASLSPMSAMRVHAYEQRHQQTTPKSENPEMYAVNLVTAVDRGKKLHEALVARSRTLSFLQADELFDLRTFLFCNPQVVLVEGTALMGALSIQEQAAAHKTPFNSRNEHEHIDALLFARAHKPDSTKVSPVKAEQKEAEVKVPPDSSIKKPPVVSTTMKAPDESTKKATAPSTPEKAASSNDALREQQRQQAAPVNDSGGGDEAAGDGNGNGGDGNKLRDTAAALHFVYKETSRLSDVMHFMFNKLHRAFSTCTRLDDERGAVNFVVPYDCRAAVPPYDMMPRLLFSLDVASDHAWLAPMWSFPVAPHGNCVAVATEMSRVVHLGEPFPPDGRRHISWDLLAPDEERVSKEVRAGIKKFLQEDDRSSEDNLRVRTALGVALTIESEEDRKTWLNKIKQCTEGELGDNFLSVYAVQHKVETRQLRFMSNAMAWRPDTTSLNGLIISRPSDRHYSNPLQSPPSHFPFPQQQQASHLLYDRWEKKSTLEANAHAESLISAKDYFGPFNTDIAAPLRVKTLWPVAYVKNPTVFYSPGLSMLSPHPNLLNGHPQFPKSLTVRANQVFSFHRPPDKVLQDERGRNEADVVVEGEEVKIPHDPDALWLVMSTLVRLSQRLTLDRLDDYKKVDDDDIKEAVTWMEQQVSKGTSESAPPTHQYKSPQGIVVLLRLDGIKREHLSDKTIRDFLKADVPPTLGIMHVQHMVDVHVSPQWTAGVDFVPIPLATTDQMIQSSLVNFNNNKKPVIDTAQPRRQFFTFSDRLVEYFVHHVLMKEQGVERQVSTYGEPADTRPTDTYRREFDEFTAGVREDALNLESIDLNFFVEVRNKFHHSLHDALLHLANKFEQKQRKKSSASLAAVVKASTKMPTIDELVAAQENDSSDIMRPEQAPPPSTTKNLARRSGNTEGDDDDGDGVDDNDGDSDEDAGRAAKEKTTSTTAAKRKPSKKRNLQPGRLKLGATPQEFSDWLDMLGQKAAFDPNAVHKRIMAACSGVDHPNPDAPPLLMHAYRAMMELDEEARAAIEGMDRWNVQAAAKRLRRFLLEHDPAALAAFHLIHREQDVAPTLMNELLEPRWRTKSPYKYVDEPDVFYFMPGMMKQAALDQIQYQADRAAAIAARVSKGSKKQNKNTGRGGQVTAKSPPRAALTPAKKAVPTIAAPKPPPASTEVVVKSTTEAAAKSAVTSSDKSKQRSVTTPPSTPAVNKTSDAPTPAVTKTPDKKISNVVPSSVVKSPVPSPALKTMTPATLRPASPAVASPGRGVTKISTPKRSATASPSIPAAPASPPLARDATGAGRLPDSGDSAPSSPAKKPSPAVTWREKASTRNKSDEADTQNDEQPRHQHELEEQEEARARDNDDNKSKGKPAAGKKIDGKESPSKKSSSTKSRNKSESEGEEDDGKKHKQTPATKARRHKTSDDDDDDGDKSRSRDKERHRSKRRRSPSSSSSPSSRGSSPKHRSSAHRSSHKRDKDSRSGSRSRSSSHSHARGHKRRRRRSRSSSSRRSSSESSSARRPSHKRGRSSRSASRDSRARSTPSRSRSHARGTASKRRRSASSSSDQSGGRSPRRKSKKSKSSRDGTSRTPSPGGRAAPASSSSKGSGRGKPPSVAGSGGSASGRHRGRHRDRDDDGQLQLPMQVAQLMQQRNGLVSGDGGSGRSAGSNFVLLEHMRRFALEQSHVQQRAEDAAAMKESRRNAEQRWLMDIELQQRLAQEQAQALALAEQRNIGLQLGYQTAFMALSPYSKGGAPGPVVSGKR